MQQQKRIFPISIIGFSDNERRLLRSMFLLTTERDRSYLIVERRDDPAGDIVLVNGDDSDAVAYSKNSSNPKHPANAPRLYLGNAALNSKQEKFIARPITTTRLLEALDHITISELDYCPELIINDDNVSHQILAEHFPPKQIPDTNAIYHALVVDDSRPVRELMKINLGLLNMSVDFAQTGEQALEMIYQHAYDIIFLDITLPGIDGYEVCKTIKANKNLKSIPVCMLTGKSSTFNKIKGKMAGCNVYLTKPVQSHDFMNVIKKLLFTHSTTNAAAIPKAGHFV